MKIIKLIFIFIFIFYFFDIVNSQLSQNNNFVSIYEYQNNNYKTHATFDNFQKCYISNRYSIINIDKPMLSISDSNVNITQSGKLLEIYFSIQALNTPQNYSFSIIDQNDESVSTDFTITLLCQKIDSNLLQISPLYSSPFSYPNPLVLSSSNGIYFTIKGLNYTLDTLQVSVISPNGMSISVIPITKEIYLGDLTNSQNLPNYIIQGLQLSIVLPNKNFIINYNPIYNSEIYQAIKVNSSFIGSNNEYTQFGYNLSPILYVDTNFTNANYPNYLVSKNPNNLVNTVKKLYILDGSTRYIVPLTNNNYTAYEYNLLFGNGSMINSDSYFSINSIAYQFNQIPSGLSSSSSNYISTSFFSGSYSYRNIPISISFCGGNLIKSFPYGFVNGSMSYTFDYNTSFHIKPNSCNIAISEYQSNIKRIFTNPNSQTTTDFQAPKINLFEFKQIQGYKYILRINSTDDTSISGFYVNYGLDSEVFYGLETLISGTNKSGYFELPIDYFSSITFSTIDSIGNIQTFYASLNTLISVNSVNVPVFLQFPFDNVELDIHDLSFGYNDIDISNQPNYNVIYFSSSTIPTNYPVLFQLLDDVSNYPDLNNNYPKPLSFSYDNDLKIFYCYFIVPKNTNTGTIPYKIFTPYNLVLYSNVLPQLRVSKSNYDNDGPLITNIQNLNSIGKVGFKLTIQDDINGFSNGYVKVVGSVDLSVFRYNFSNTDLVNDQYTLVINSYETCIEQNYTIDTIYLEDLGGRYSYYNRFNKFDQSIINPLRYFTMNQLPTILNSETIICSGKIDPSPPKILSLWYDKTSVDVGSFDRTIIFYLYVEDPDTGIMTNQNPIIYLQTSNLKILECESYRISNNETNATFYCEIELPFLFAYPDDILISVYGILNNGGYFGGSSSGDLGYTISTVFNNVNPYITGYEPYYNYSSNNLILYGKNFGKATSVQVKYSIGTHSYTPSSIIGDSVIVVPIYVDGVQVIGPFNVTVLTKNAQSNTITINPIYFEKITFTPTQTPSPTPIPTNSPQKCFGTPVCGGPTNGYCNVNTGCVCYSPFVGIDCSSQIIIVPPPKINNTNPTTEIPINENGSNNNGTDSSSVFYKSLISLYAIRELSIDQKEINKYEFNKWLYNEIDNTTHLYYSNITTKDNKIVNITATLKWFTNETTIEFANQNLLMNPSSMKYTIEISNYQFKSKLNSLQLIMFASFDSNQTSNTCSSKQFGDTSSGDNSNYLKIQIENKSLYGRFIKRGIIDNSNIVSLSNQLLDDELNSIESSHQIQSFIGITLPYFNQNAIIDPDFSVLVDSKTADSICDNKSSKLSGTQIAGIAVGCAVFFCAVVVSIIYVVVKKRKEKKFIKTVSNKLHNLK